MLAGGADLEAVAPVNDKPAFAARAQAAALPVVPTLARLAPGGQVEQFAPLPAADLFVKLAAGKGGRGAQKWRYLADQDRYHRLGDGAEVARDQFLSWLAAHTPDASLIVQPNLVNHPDLADLALDAVATCRIITILDESGVPEPVIAIFRMPATRGAIVDNLHRGGVAAPVDITTGMLGGVRVRHGGSGHPAPPPPGLRRPDRRPEAPPLGAGAATRLPGAHRVPTPGVVGGHRHRTGRAGADRGE